MREPVETRRLSAVWTLIESAVALELGTDSLSLDTFVPVRTETPDELHVTFTSDKRKRDSAIDGQSVVARTYSAEVDSIDIEHRLRLRGSDLDETTLPLDRIRQWAVAARSVERSEVFRSLAQRPDVAHSNHPHLTESGVATAFRRLSGLGAGDCRLVVFSAAEKGDLVDEHADLIDLVRAPASEAPSDVGGLMMCTGPGPAVVRCRDLTLDWSARSEDGVELLLSERFRLDWPAVAHPTCVLLRPDDG